MSNGIVVVAERVLLGAGSASRSSLLNVPKYIGARLGVVSSQASKSSSASKHRCALLLRLALVVGRAMEAREQGMQVAVEGEDRKAQHRLAVFADPAVPEAGDAERRAVGAADAPAFRFLRVVGVVRHVEALRRDDAPLPARPGALEGGAGGRGLGAGVHGRARRAHALGRGLLQAEPGQDDLALGGFADAEAADDRCEITGRDVGAPLVGQGLPPLALELGGRGSQEIRRHPVTLALPGGAWEGFLAVGSELRHAGRAGLRALPGRPRRRPGP